MTVNEESVIFRPPKSPATTTPSSQGLSVNSDVHPRLVTGSSIISHRPLISPNERWLLCICGRQIRIYSIDNGKLQSVLQPSDDAESGQDLVALVFNPRNVHTQVYSASAGGTINLWDYEDGVLVKKYEIAFRISGMFMPTRDDGIFLLEQTEESREIALPEPGVKLYNHSTDVTTHTLVNFANLEKSSIKRRPRTVIRLLSGDPKKIAFDSKRMLFIAAINGNALRIAFTGKEKFIKHIVPGRKMVSLAVHPVDGCIATGDEFGRIILWRGFDEYRTTNKTVLHWHWSPVADLAFSAEGSYLWSGGLEVTLVQWSLTQNGQRDFLPRLGSAINHIVVSGQNGLVALSLDDGAIQLVSLQRTLLGSIQSLSQPAGKNRHSSSIFSYDPASCCLVLGGNAGTLQFYDPRNDKVVKKVDVVSQNIIGSKETSSANAELTAVAFSANGSWMGTAEFIKYEHFGGDCLLKFWTLDPESKSYSVRSSIIAPHDQNPATFLQFSPASQNSRTSAVSIGKDDCKLWMEWSEKTLTGSRSVFVCVGQMNFRDFRPTTAAFSSDGNVLAVAFDEFVTFWDVDHVEMRDQILVGRREEGSLRHVSFADADKTMFTASGSCCRIWDLNSWTVLKSVDLYDFLLVRSPFSSIYANIRPDSVSFLRSDNTEPAVSFRLPNLNVCSALFMPNPDRSINSGLDVLYFITDTGEVWTVDDDQQDSDSHNAQKLPSIEEKQSALAKLLAASLPVGQIDEPKRKESVEKRNKKNNFIQKLFDAPVHTMASPSYFLSEHLDSLLSTKTRREHGAENSLEVEEQDPEPEVGNAEDDSGDEMIIDGMQANGLKENGSAVVEEDEKFESDEPISFEFLKNVGTMPTGSVFEISAALCRRIRNIPV